MIALDLFTGPAPVARTYDLLTAQHYLGPTRTALFSWQDEHGCMVFGRPRSRRLPGDWLELLRWCLIDGQGSRQWSAFVRWARANRPETTCVSYSDPVQGHTGALYRACGWLWAPTWHRLRPPPSGNGNWGSGAQATKDQWIFPLRPDTGRERALCVNDDGLRARMPWAEYREPAWRRGRFDPRTGGGNYRKWTAA